MVETPQTDSLPARAAPKSVFFAVTVMVFILTLSAAESVGFVPYYVDGTEPRSLAGQARTLAIADLPELGDEVEPVEITTPVSGVAKPSRIRIPSVGMDLPVSNPETRDTEELFDLLKAGPARFVDSALLGEKGNVIIFGHSSHLPVVSVPMYKAFNSIPKLKAGDSIMIEGGGKEYMYSVISVKKVDVSVGQIDMSKEGNKLTIVTCDTLSGKSARFVLEAELIGSYAME